MKVQHTITIEEEFVAEDFIADPAADYTPRATDVHDVARQSNAYAISLTNAEQFKERAIELLLYGKATSISSVGIDA